MSLLQPSIDGLNKYREKNYDLFNPSTKRFLLMLYPTRDDYITAREHREYDKYIYLEDAIVCYNSALEMPNISNDACSRLCLKKLGVPYLDEMFDPLIAAGDRLIQVLNDPVLFKQYTSGDYATINMELE